MPRISRLILAMLCAAVLIAGIGSFTDESAAQDKVVDKKKKKKDPPKTEEKKDDKKEEKKEEKKEPFKADPAAYEFKGHTSWVFAVAFDLEGKTVASASRDLTVKVWDLATKKDVQTLKGHPTQAKALSFFKDQLLVTTGKWVKEKKAWEGEIKVWDVKAGKEQPVMRGFQKVAPARSKGAANVHQLDMQHLGLL